MNLDELKKHVIFQCIFVTFVVVCLAFTLFWLLTENVKAATGYTTLDISTTIQNTDRCGSIASGYYCNATTQSQGDQWFRSSYNSGRYGLLSIEFTYRNLSWLTSTNSTIALISNEGFKNISYFCTASSGSCNAVYSNSSRININFTTPSNTDRITFFVTANGNTWDRTNVSDFHFTEFRFIQPKITDSSNTDIIHANTENTDRVIDSQNQNTQDIIHQVQDLIANNEELTQNIINGMSCPVGPLPLTIQEYSYINNKYLNSSGENVTQSGYSISSYVELKPNTEYKVQLLDTLNLPSLCFYRGKSQSQLISCIQYARQNNITFTTPNIAGVVYTMFSLSSRGISINGPVCNDWQREAQEKLNQLQNDTNSYLRDDSDPTINDGALSDTLDLVSVDDPLGYLATLPLTLLSKINTNLSSNTCTPFSLGRFGGSSYNFTLPCIQPEQYLGSSIWTFIDLIVSVGLLSISVYKLHHTINNFLGMGSENEVNSYSAYWSPMEFLMIILGGGKGYDAAYKNHFGGDD